MEELIDGKPVKTRTFGETDVYSAQGIIKNISPTIKSIFENGMICVVYESACYGITNAVVEEFKRAGFRIALLEVGSAKSVPDFCRFVFAVGSEDAADLAADTAGALGTLWSLLWTSPDTDKILCGYAPKQVFIDENVMIKCRYEDIAAGWGIVLSEPVRQFDEYFSRKVLDGGSLDTEISVKPKELSKTCAYHELALRLLEISFSKRGFDAAEIMAEVLYDMVKKQGNIPRKIGEYKFVCSCVLSVFYSNFLGSPAIDTLLPRSHNEITDLTEKLTFVNRSNLIKSIDFFDINSYFRVSYILSEYRMDLLEKLSGANAATERFWRRLYPDAGYHLKGAMTARMLLTALAIAGEFSGGLLGYAATTGITDIFVKQYMTP